MLMEAMPTLYRPLKHNKPLIRLQTLAAMLVEVCKNPRNPGFNHYLFESVAALIRHGTAASPASIADYEAALFPAFELVLQQDVQVRRVRVMWVC